MITKVDPETTLTNDIVLLEHDPLGFVRYVFPWMESGTPLFDEAGPDVWQEKVLIALGEASRKAETEGELATAVQIAVRSGHGVGKGALSAWIILWFMSTRINPQIVVTANTKIQLDTKTWRELAKWHGLAINKHWFKWTATRFSAVDHAETWFAAAIPWSEHNSEAFAGTHEKNVLVLFDEASAVADKIWEVASGAMTTPGAFWLVFGNPTQNTGRFAECWGRERHRWRAFQVDSRTAKKANKAQIQQWIDDYGDDSDFVRVRVKGEAPRASSTQFISGELVDLAMQRTLEASAYEYAPIVMGVDVARFGDDQTVMVIRRGLKLLHIERHRELDLMQTSARVARLEDMWGVDVTFIDAIGLGAGVVDRLHQLGRKCIGVVSASKATDRRYYNLRAQMWGDMKDWLEQADLPTEATMRLWGLIETELKTDLTSPEYGYDVKGSIQLEKKEDMKSRGCASPDTGDAIALTFALPVVPESMDEEEEEDRSAHERRGMVTGY